MSYNPGIFGPTPAGVSLVSAGYCPATRLGTSIGHDRSITDILTDIRVAVDPRNATLASLWNTTAGVQPCGPYSGQPFPTRLGYGDSWPGVTCQESATYGGISALDLSTYSGAAVLRGTLPVQLRELRSAARILLSEQLLSSTIPAAWGTPQQWTYFSPTVGFDSLVLLKLDGAREAAARLAIACPPIRKPPAAQLRMGC